VDSDTQRHLVERAREGDGSAWECLYRNVYPRLRAYAVSHAGMASAEDLTNETMARAVAGIGRFRWEASGFDGWLFGILRRVCSEHHRRQGRQRRDARFGPERNGSEPGDDLELAEDHAAVRKAFAQLTLAEQEILELRLVSRLSSEDTARVLGKRPGTVRTAQSRALANLRKLMEQQT
jgi:RNA polymerase sigma-70 factor (ECF subfamily)